MERSHPAAEPGPGISRTDLQLVIRRAAELYTRDAEADEQLTEAEVMRVAEELGLPGRYVRQALYELPVATQPAGRLDRWYGPAYVHGTRVVPAAPPLAMDQLEEYLVTREYLQLLRRHGTRAAFVPADDAISSFVRALRRPGRNWHIARSRRVLVEVRPMPDDESHVRIELDVGKQRARTLRAGIAGGAAIGIPIAALVAVPMGAVAFDAAGTAAGSAVAITTGLTTLAGSVTAGLAVGRARFRHRIDGARLEVAALLDRVETGGSLQPPAAPWLRSLRSRISAAVRGTPRP